MTVVVSILNWNSLAKTMTCLESLKALEYPELVVCVTDNNSLSFCVDSLREVYPGLVMFENTENLGFAGGQYQALAYARKLEATAFWMLNSDTRVFPDTLSHLLDALTTHGKGVYGSAAVNQQGVLSTELIWELEKTSFKTRFNPLTQEKLSKGETLRVANIVGYSFLVPVSVIEEHGFMDSSYFLYYEETDYCLSLLNQGVPSYWVGASRVYHEKEGSTKSNLQLKEVMEYYLYRNLFVFLQRHGSLRMIFHYFGRFAIRFLSANVARRRKVPVLTKKHLVGILHAFTGKRGKYYAPDNYM
jgi:GT2 family glycosyltransferase